MLLLDQLILKFPASTRSTLKRMVAAGRVTINGKVARKLKQEVSPSDKITLLDRPKRPPKAMTGLKGAVDSPLSFPILHEDEDVMVILKPPGLLTSTNEKEKRPTVAAKLKAYLAATEPAARLGIIHRLDRDASGLLVFSKNVPAFRHLKNQFFHHTVERLYTAVIEGVPTPKGGKIENFLLELPDGRVVKTRDPAKGQIAITPFEMVTTVKIAQPPRLPDAPKDSAPPTRFRTLLKVKLETGRKHQIRAHFASRNTPIANDPLYGDDPDPKSRLMLAATSLAFDHPRTGERMKFEVDPPKEITQMFADKPEAPKA